MLRSSSTKHDVLDALNLLEHQLGVDSATALANRARVKLQVIADDPKHEIYDFLCLSQFAYYMKHYAKTDFLDVYFVMPGELCKRRLRFGDNVTNFRPRRPILTRLFSRWCIHDAKQWVLCSSMEDALLKILRLWATEYNSELADRIDLRKWIALVTEPTNEESY
jgi:hypothetical protein